VRPGVCRIHEQPICVGVTPRSLAIFRATAAISKSLSLKYMSFRIWSVCARLVGPSPRPRLRWPSRKSRARGLQGIVAIPLINAKRHHLALFLSIDQVVVILHRHEPLSAVLLRRILRFGKLPGPHTACTEITHFAHAHECIESIEHFFKAGLFQLQGPGTVIAAAEPPPASQHAVVSAVILEPAGGTRSPTGPMYLKGARR
jgi:hypothetical protein